MALKTYNYKVVVTARAGSSSERLFNDEDKLIEFVASIIDDWKIKSVSVEHCLVYVEE